MCRLRNIAMGVWQTDGRTDRQTDGQADRQTDGRTDRQTTDKEIPMCHYASQATQLLCHSVGACVKPYIHHVMSFMKLNTAYFFKSSYKMLISHYFASDVMNVIVDVSEQFLHKFLKTYLIHEIFFLVGGRELHCDKKNLKWILISYNFYETPCLFYISPCQG